MGNKYEREAAAFCAAIRDIAKDEDALNNLESYLSAHFGDWLEKYASTPLDISAEMKCFAHIYDSERSA